MIYARVLEDLKIKKLLFGHKIFSMGRRALVLGRIDARERYEDEGRSFGPIGAIGAEKKIETGTHSGGFEYR